MKDRIETLLDKYYEGETSLAEERELKALLLNSNDYEEEKAFFGGMGKLENIIPTDPKLPTSDSAQGLLAVYWLKYAAVLLLFLGATFMIYTHQREEAERKAYEEVMSAFAIINTNMQKGTSKLEVMEGFHHINTSHELFNLKEIKQGL